MAHEKDTLTEFETAMVELKRERCVEFCRSACPYRAQVFPHNPPCDGLHGCYTAVAMLRRFRAMVEEEREAMV